MTKQIQIIAYADDVVIIARNVRALRETFTQLKQAAEERGLKVNENKTKYMRQQKNKSKNQDLRIGKYVFEEVQTFKYLGKNINDRGEDIKERIQAGNRAYYSNKNILKDKSISKRTKLRIYKGLIRPVVMYAAETLCLTKREEEHLRIWERRILRIILGPKKISNTEYRSKMNHELLEEIKGKDIVRTIKAQRLRWIGHIWRSNDDKMIKRITLWQPTLVRRKGRPRMRWIEEVEEDIRRMEITRWKEKTANRKQWRDIVETATAHKKL